MARIESTAKGGFYATPQHLVPILASLVCYTESSWSSPSVVDPCAGEGDAVVEFAQEAFGDSHKIFGCELEDERFVELEGRVRNSEHGDAFLLEFRGVASVLYLNPPYDTDPMHGRLEQKFLNRFGATLHEDGVLIFLVPFYALAASAETLATEFTDVRCFRFPGKDFEAYKQVALLARKIPTRDIPDQEVLAKVQAWAKNPPRAVLRRGCCDPYEAPYGGRFQWELRDVDLLGLLEKSRPWHKTVGQNAVPVPHVLPEGDIEDLLFRSYPVATPPRPAHIASGIASGLLNGRRIEAPGRDPLLVKGVFDKEFASVDEKRNKDGEVTTVIQVQQPKLTTTALNLRTKKYEQIGSEGALSVEELIREYGPSMLNVIEQQCPITYDPRREDDTELAPVDRKLFQAQDHAARALVKLLGGNACKDRRGRSAILLGEIGSGKTSCVLAAAKTVARRVVVVCPPHLLTSWQNEITATVPEAYTSVLEDITSVDEFFGVDAPLSIGILSREKAKLGHGWEGVPRTCPKCGAEVPPVDLAKKRVRCDHQEIAISGDLAERFQELCQAVLPCFPSLVEGILRGRFDQVRIQAYKKNPRPWSGLDPQWVISTLDLLENKINAEKARVWTALHAEENDIVRRVRKEFDARGYCWQRFDVLIPPERKRAEGFRGDGWSSAGTVTHDEGGVRVKGHAANSPEAIKELFAALLPLVKITRQKACGEPLFQATGVRRYPLSKYICRKYPKSFDLLVLDEGHEYNNTDSAQGRSAHRLTALGVPTILMTGSLMNGYARSLFSNMWALSGDFRYEFERDEASKFVDRYGYKKVAVQLKDGDGEVVAFGSTTDRVERSVRVVGQAPGVLPLFLFRHLLPIAVTIHKADLAVDLPECRQIPCTVAPTDELRSRYDILKGILVAQVRKDMFEPERSGRLMGALAELPSYLDRATGDTGNVDSGAYEVYYPESVGGELVASQEPFPEETLLPKEEWMLETLARELEGGRNVMILTWHVNLMPRMRKIIEKRLGIKVAVLNSDKVSTGKRQNWIDREILKKKRRVLVVNPVAVQTGLNNLVHFQTQVWMENPACNPIVYRQTMGRIDRIGQRMETRVFFPVYGDTLQTSMYDLLLRKVAISTATDGIDPEAALEAAGATEVDNYLVGLSLGRQLWSLIQDDISV